MTKKVILHIGTEKTGTTSIQGFLADNRSALAKAGWLYPQSLGEGPQIALTASCLSYDERSNVLRACGIYSPQEHTAFSRKTMAALNAEMQQKPDSNIVVSDEHINVHLLKADQLRKLKDTFDVEDVEFTICAYFRRQHHLLGSMLSEAIKNGVFNVYNFSDPVSSVRNIPVRFNYLAIINNFCRAFPKATFAFRPYMRDGIVDDFVEHTGLGAVQLVHSKYDLNRSVPGRIIPALAEIGPLLREIDNGHFERNWRRIVAHASALFPGPSFKLSADQASLFQERFEEMNREIVSKFSELTLVLGEQDTHDSQTSDAPISSSELCDAISRSSDGPEVATILKLSQQLQTASA